MAAGDVGMRAACGIVVLEPLALVVRAACHCHARRGLVLRSLPLPNVPWKVGCIWALCVLKRGLQHLHLLCWSGSSANDVCQRPASTRDALPYPAHSRPGSNTGRQAPATRSRLQPCPRHAALREQTCTHCLASYAPASSTPLCGTQPCAAAWRHPASHVRCLAPPPAPPSFPAGTAFRARQAPWQDRHLGRTPGLRATARSRWGALGCMAVSSRPGHGRDVGCWPHPGSPRLER